MAEKSTHEPTETLSAATLDMHRAINSLMEELEAVDWYQQRAETCADDALRAVLIHNKNEEVEHAMMNLEWIRRNSPIFDAQARKFLFTEGPIEGVEAGASAGEPAPPARGAGLGIASLNPTRKP